MKTKIQCKQSLSRTFPSKGKNKGLIDNRSQSIIQLSLINKMNNTIQLAKNAGGWSLGYIISGHELFLNNHFTMPEEEKGENFHPHITTQVYLDKKYVGSIRTFYNPDSKKRYNRIDKQLNENKTMTKGMWEWAMDTHNTAIVKCFGK